MSSGTVAPREDTTAGSPRSWRRWPPSRRVLVVAAVVALAAAALGAVWAWWRVSVFVDAGGWGMTGVQEPTDSPLYIGMTDERDDARGDVSISSVDAVVVRNTAGAVIEFYVCTVDPSSGIGSIGSVHEREAHHECSRLVPAEGATLRLHRDPRDQLVMAVSLRHAGVVHVRAADVTYAEGWHRGHQQVGGDVVLRRPVETNRKAGR